MTNCTCDAIEALTAEGPCPAHPVEVGCEVRFVREDSEVVWGAMSRDRRMVFSPGYPAGMSDDEMARKHRTVAFVDDGYFSVRAHDAVWAPVSAVRVVAPPLKVRWPCPCCGAATEDRLPLRRCPAGCSAASGVCGWTDSPGGGGWWHENGALKFGGGRSRCTLHGQTASPSAAATVSAAPVTATGTRTLPPDCPRCGLPATGTIDGGPACVNRACDGRGTAIRYLRPKALPEPGRWASVRARTAARLAALVAIHEKHRDPHGPYGLIGGALVEFGDRNPMLLRTPCVHESEGRRTCRCRTVR